MTTLLNTHFCGLELQSPVVMASSPLTESLDRLLRASAYGYGAAITKSISVCPIIGEKNGQRRTYIDKYGFWASSTFSRETLDLSTGTELIRQASKATSLPILASVTGLTTDTDSWYKSCRQLAKAGAQAVQLDFFYLKQPLMDFEQFTAILKLCEDLVKNLTIPVIPKLNVHIPSYIAAAAFSRKNASAISLIDSGRVPSPFSIVGGKPILCFNSMTNPGMSSLFGDWLFPLALHYTFVISRLSNQEICAGGGVTEPDQAITLLGHGASCIQVATGAMTKNRELVVRLNGGLEEAVRKNGLKNISELRGILSSQCRTDAEQGQAFFLPSVASIDRSKCQLCGACQQWVFCDSLYWANGIPDINITTCEGCGFCVNSCPAQAINIRAKNNL